MFLHLQAVAEDIDIKYLASLCLSCHTANQIQSQVIPSLIGYDKKKFLKFFEKTLASNDKSSVMYQISQGYSQNEIQLMADFFSSRE